MKPEELAKRLVGRTITAVGVEPGYIHARRTAVRIQWIDLDDGSRVSLDVGPDTQPLPWVEVSL